MNKMMKYIESCENILSKLSEDEFVVKITSDRTVINKSHAKEVRFIVVV